jgi:predicted 2-oxoglutarate/Fe(II)-dependent dioxygenase YbiX
MSKRLQVLLDDVEYRALQKVARAERITVAEWVRQALRAARRRLPTRDADRKLASIRAATAHEFPTADVPQMLADIERGYLGTDSR